MTDSQNGAYPASGLPEPPYRAHSNQQQPPQELGTQPEPYEAPERTAVQAMPEAEQVQVPPAAPVADTSGIDAQGETFHTSLYSPVPSSDNTESFAAARMGDTGSMPAVQAPMTSASAAPAPFESGYASQSPSSQGYYSTPNAASQPGGSGAYSASVASGTAAQEATPRAAAPSAKTKAKGGAGKTFLCGFLGAALACGLAFGGNAVLNGGNNSAATHAALIGTTDQSVINAVDEGQTLAEAVAAKALPSVVAVYNYQNQPTGYGYGFGYGSNNQSGDSMVQTGMGSGVVISDEGYIITNYHVVENAAKLTVSVNGVERDATYVGGDNTSDVAVIKVDNTEGLTAADIGDSDSLRIGEWVMTVGAPLGLESSVATGVVSATNRSTIMSSNGGENDLYSYFYGNQNPEYTYYPNMIQTDAVINPGNSGGALVDADGKLIGINAMISSYSGDYAGVGFAIPINYAIQIAQNVIDGKEPTHAMIGVSLSQVNSQIAQQYNLSANSGAYISAITPGSGADNSDLQVGDIITKVGGKAVTSPIAVTLEVRAHKVGDTVTLTVNRDGEEKDIDVTLGSDENATKAQDSQNQNQGQDQGQQGQQGNGRDNGNGGNGRMNGFSEEDLQRLFEMLNM